LVDGCFDANAFFGLDTFFGLVEDARFDPDARFVFDILVDSDVPVSLDVCTDPDVLVDSDALVGPDGCVDPDVLLALVVLGARFLFLDLFGLDKPLAMVKIPKLRFTFIGAPCFSIFCFSEFIHSLEMFI